MKKGSYTIINYIAYFLIAISLGLLCTLNFDQSVSFEIKCIVYVILLGMLGLGAYIIYKFR